jgi:hypothetical protein
LEGEVENAIAAEDFDQADRLQADLDAANVSVDYILHGCCTSILVSL